MKRITYILTLIITAFITRNTVYARDLSIDSLMNQLDKVIADRERYITSREKDISDVRNRLHSTTNDSIKFDLAGKLFDLYNPFNTDSAYYYTLERERIARKIGNNVYILNARMNQASVLSAVGMYQEASSIINSIKSSDLPDYLIPYYFHIKRTLNGHLADYSAFRQPSSEYASKTNAYRDSLLSVNDTSSLAYAITEADKYNSLGKYKEAIEGMKRFIETHTLSEHDKAICAWTLSESYGHIGDTENQKKQLIISSIGDMKGAVREYVSLRQLALMLYKEGDLERAYRFMNIAVDDATRCNARQRIVELNSTYPEITAIYVEKVKRQQRTLIWALGAITLLSVFLVILIFYLRKQMRIITASRKELADANTRLNNLNNELKAFNDKLSEANRAIAENSHLKEVYIARYMDQCMNYIDKLDSYRKSLMKMINAGKINDVKNALKSDVVANDELKAFYENFDNTFLKIFPSFVEDFNNLLLPEEKIIPKKDGALTTELRIYALVRLGITDSDKIAKFLRYSLTTIYNYRTKMRNKAKGDRNSFESDVMRIGEL